MKSSAIFCLLLTVSIAAKSQTLTERYQDFDSLRVLNLVVNITIDSDQVNVREETSILSDRLGSLNRGDVVEAHYMGSGGLWAVSLESGVGFITDENVVQNSATNAYKTRMDERREEYKKQKEIEEQRLKEAAAERRRIEREEKERKRQIEIEKWEADELRAQQEVRARNRERRNNYVSLKQSQGIYLVINKAYPSKPNSADGVGVRLEVDLLNKKTIKYLSFTVEPYNSVGDKVTRVFPGDVTSGIKVTGPMKENTGFKQYYWDPLWYNNTISCLKITRASIEYIDGEIETFERGDLSKLYGRGFDNDCSYKE